MNNQIKQALEYCLREHPHVNGTRYAVRADIAALDAQPEAEQPSLGEIRQKMRADMYEGDLHLAKQEIAALKANVAAPVQPASKPISDEALDVLVVRLHEMFDPAMPRPIDCRDTLRDLLLHLTRCDTSKKASDAPKQEPVAWMVDGRIERGLTFDKAAAEAMADVNCGTVRSLVFGDEGCTRSHPHENMDADCQRKTVEARARHKEASDAPKQEPVAFASSVYAAMRCFDGVFSQGSSQELRRSALERQASELMKYPAAQPCQEQVRNAALEEAAQVCGKVAADADTDVASVMKCFDAIRSLRHQPAPEAGKAGGLPDGAAQLCQFYDVSTLPALVKAQVDHIERLQEKLREFSAEADKVGGRAIHKILTNPVRWTSDTPTAAATAGLADSVEWMDLINKLLADPSFENAGKLTEFAEKYTPTATAPSAVQSEPAQAVLTEQLCPTCGGHGSIGTGIAEWSSTQCSACDGTGLLGSAKTVKTGENNV